MMFAATSPRKGNAMNDNAKRAGNKPAKPSPDMFTESAVQPRPTIVADAPTAPEPVAVDDIETAAQPAVDVPVTIETTNEFRAPPAARGAIVAHDGSSVLAAPDTSPRIVNGGVVCASMRDVMNMARHYIRGAMVPRGLDGRSQIETESRVAIAIEFGLNLGLTPLQSLQSVMVTNGRPCLWGDAPMALVSQHKAFEGTKTEWAGDGDKFGCTFTVFRLVKNKSVPHAWTFTIEDAKRAGLWGKTGPWSTNPKRMLMIRARAFALRDAFPDALRGSGIAEEMEDIQPATDKTAALQSRLESVGVSRGVDQNEG
jgi:hypothetical protein